MLLLRHRAGLPSQIPRLGRHCRYCFAVLCSKLNKVRLARMAEYMHDRANLTSLNPFVREAESGRDNLEIRKSRHLMTPSRGTAAWLGPIAIGKVNRASSMRVGHILCISVPVLARERAVSPRVKLAVGIAIATLLMLAMRGAGQERG